MSRKSSLGWFSFGTASPLLFTGNGKERVLWLIQIIRDLTQQLRVPVPSNEILVTIAASDTSDIPCLVVVFDCEVPAFLLRGFAADGAPAPLRMEDILVVL